VTSEVLVQLPVLVERLNEIHGTRLEPRFWRKAVSLSLLRHVTFCYDMFQVCRAHLRVQEHDCRILGERSFFVPDDFNGELELMEGPHRIEIRAPGYETLAFDVRIAPHRSVTYRGALKPAEATPDPDPAIRQQPDNTTGVAPQPVTPATPMTFYVIPGCYAGNVAPKDVALPATCDLSRLVTYGP